MSNVQAAAYLPTITTQQDQVATGLITFDWKQIISMFITNLTFLTIRNIS
jgi:hypothetical protein